MRAEQTLAFAVDEDADREVLQKTGLLGADGALLDPSREGQAARKRAQMDGEATAAARRLRRGRVADDADNADDKAAAYAFEKRERRPARRGAARRAATAARAARLAGGALSLPLLVGESPIFIAEPSVAVRNEAAAALFSGDAEGDAAGCSSDDFDEAPRGTGQGASCCPSLGGAAAAGTGGDAE